MPVGDASNIAHFWAQLIVDELVRCGVEVFFLAPGSRSTPLVTAAARHPKAQSVVHFDERGTAFCALGYARATGQPATWITTSGTAVANGLPAVVEASTDAMPLLLITADRPPELRDTSANQTIDQVKMFGDYVRWQFDLPAPTPAVDPAMVLTTVDQAVHRARRTPGGPVHLNCMFRKPLHPEADPHDIAALADGLGGWTAQDRPYTRYDPMPPRVDSADVAALAQELRGIERGLLVAGRMDAAARADIRLLAKRLGWPLLADVGSQLRLGSARAEAAPIGYYDQLLASETFCQAHRPDAVLHVGGRFVSKRLRQFLDRSRPDRYVVAHNTPFRLDPNHQVSRRFEVEPAAFCKALLEALDDPSEDVSPWTDSWRSASARAGRQLDAFVEQADVLSEPLAARLVSRHLPEEHGLVLASSMPVRDMDRYAALDGPAASSAANRGASGIDGTVATAAGFARGSQAPVTLLIGDLALLHDLNALALLQQSAPPVIVVVLNNHGGGIFSFLPIAAYDDVFEDFFETPHPFSFEHAAAMFDLDYQQPDSKAAFLDAYRTASNGDRSTLIEVTTDRADNHALHQQLEERITTAVSEFME